MSDVQPMPYLRRLDEKEVREGLERLPDFRKPEEVAPWWEQQFDLFRNELLRFQSKEHEIGREIERGFAMFPYLGPYLQAGHETIRELWKKVEDFLIDVLTRPGNPAALIVAADAWGQQVSKRFGAIETTLTKNEPGKDGDHSGDPNINAQRKWDGPAGDAYQASADKQTEAVKGAQQIANTLQNGLQSIATELIMFHAALLSALITLLAELIAGIATIVLDGIGVAVIVGALATFLTTAIGLGTALASALNTAKEFENSLDQAKGFKDKVAWPKPEDVRTGW